MERAAPRLPSQALRTGEPIFFSSTSEPDGEIIRGPGALSSEDIYRIYEQEKVAREAVELELERLRQTSTAQVHELQSTVSELTTTNKRLRSRLGALLKSQSYTRTGRVLTWLSSLHVVGGFFSGIWERKFEKDEQIRLHRQELKSQIRQQKKGG